jgi:hypothetical protein
VKFRNPWIDPRIVQLRPEDAQAYLVRHGWKLVGPAENPLFLMFERPGGGEDSPTLLVPLQRDQGPMLQRMIELVSDLAHAEDRWAVDVLIEMLRQPAEGVPANGPTMPAKAEPAPK